VAGRSVKAIARALSDAMAARDRLGDLGVAARRATETRADAARCDPAVADWVLA
jgi:hypothetical protein